MPMMMWKVKGKINGPIGTTEACKFDLPLRTDTELKQFVKWAWGVEIPDVQVCPNHTTPWRAFADAYFARHRVTVWKASRGFGGKSFLLALLGLTEAVTLKADVNILGGSGEQSENVHRYAKQFWNYGGAPSNLLASDPLKRETRLVWGNVIKALLASSRSVRGPHPQRLRLDECIAGSAKIYTPNGVKAMREVKIGDIVYGWDTCNIIQGVVSYVRHTGIKPTLAIELSNGKTLVCTSDHKVLTDDGWKKAEEGKAGDILRGLSSATLKAYTKQHDRHVHDLLEQIQIRACTQMRRLWKAIAQSQKSLVQKVLEETRCCAKEILRRLRHRGSTSINPVSPVQFQVPGTAKAALYRLWQEVKTARYKALSGVLAEGTIKDRWPGADDSGPGHGNEKQKKALKSRAAVPRTTRLIWAGVGYTGTNEPMDSGLHSKRSWISNRSSWRILARQAEGSGARCTEESISGRDRVSSAFSAHRQDASLDAIPVGGIEVLAVSDGPVTDVWDIAVDRLHSFVVEGVIVHNCDEMDLSILDAALGQTMSKDGIPAQTVISSTHQYADGTMTKVLQRAAEKDWPVAEWCYRETEKGWLDPAEVEGKRQDVTTVMWSVEYDLQEPSPESRAIQPVSVEAMFRAGLGQFRGSNGEYIEIEPPLTECLACGLVAEFSNECPECRSNKTEPIRYATGADWARKTDWTVIPTARLDVHPARVVAFERCGRLPWPVMVGKFNARLARYGGRARHDGTGLGDVVDGYLEYSAAAFIMVGRARSILLSRYISAVERGEIESPDITFMHNEHKLASVDDVYGSGHLPDSIAAMALLWEAADVGQVFPFGHA